MIREEFRVDGKISGLAYRLHVAREVRWPVLEPNAFSNSRIGIARILYVQNVAILDEVHKREEHDKDEPADESNRSEPFEWISSGYRVMEYGCVHGIK
jgi:hypothetical protein